MKMTPSRAIRDFPGPITTPDKALLANDIVGRTDLTYDTTANILQNFTIDSVTSIGAASTLTQPETPYNVLVLSTYFNGKSLTVTEDNIELVRTILSDEEQEVESSATLALFEMVTNDEVITTQLQLDAINEMTGESVTSLETAAQRLKAWASLGSSRIDSQTLLDAVKTIHDTSEGRENTSQKITFDSATKAIRDMGLGNVNNGTSITDRALVGQIQDLVNDHTLTIDTATTECRSLLKMTTADQIAAAKELIPDLAEKFIENDDPQRITTNAFQAFVADSNFFVTQSTLSLVRTILDDSTLKIRSPIRYLLARPLPTVERIHLIRNIMDDQTIGDPQRLCKFNQEIQSESQLTALRTFLDDQSLTIDNATRAIQEYADGIDTDVKLDAAKTLLGNPELLMAQATDAVQSFNGKITTQEALEAVKLITERDDLVIDNATNAIRGAYPTIIAKDHEKKVSDLVGKTVTIDTATSWVLDNITPSGSQRAAAQRLDGNTYTADTATHRLELVAQNFRATTKQDLVDIATLLNVNSSNLTLDTATPQLIPIEVTTDEGLAAVRTLTKNPGLTRNTADQAIKSFEGDIDESDEQKTAFQNLVGETMVVDATLIEARNFSIISENGCLEISGRSCKRFPSSTDQGANDLFARRSYAAHQLWSQLFRQPFVQRYGKGNSGSRGKALHGRVRSDQDDLPRG